MILLINPGNLSQVYQGLGDGLSAIEPPSLTALFAGYLRNKEISVEIIDAPANGFTSKGVAELIKFFKKPTLIVIVVYGFQPSASTQNMPSAIAIAKAIKAIGVTAPILLTGTHPSALPEETLRETPEVDYVASGEGPQTISSLFYYLKKSINLDEVPGLHWRFRDTILSNDPPELISDLDKEMPHAAWDLLPMEKYRAHNWHCFGEESRRPYASIHTSLGCPFKCSFCCINAPFGKPSYRMWSPALIGEEIDILYHKYGVRNLKFVDEMFVLNKEHVLGICDELIKRDYNLNIWAYARVDTVREEFLDKLRLAGFRWLALGIESGSKHVRDGVEKGRFGQEEIIKTVRKVQAAGINVIGNYIFGLPDDTYASMNETLDLAVEANCEFANFYSAMAYPGSKLYTMAGKKGWKLPDSWEGYSQHSYETYPLPTDTLSPAEVLSFRDKAFQTYFSNEKYLSMIKAKFGERATEEINRMLKVKLKRKILI